MTIKTDEALLEAARAGDRRALEELLERHQAQVYRFGIRMCGHPEDARDVLQETLLAMARGLKDFRGASSLSSWLYTIARSFCIKRRRRSKFAPAPERSLETDAAAAVAGLADPGKGPEEALMGKRIEQALAAAIAGLAPSYREVLVLRDIEGLTAPEVAEVIGISVSAVKSRLHRARTAIRDQMAPVLGMDAGDEREEACPDVLSLFSQHLEGDISADVCAAMERHIEGCARCRGACESLERTLALCRTADTGLEVPAAVQAAVKAALRQVLDERR